MKRSYTHLVMWHRHAVFAGFVALPLVFSGCVSYRATTQDSRELRFSTVQVQPAWQYENRVAPKLILPLLGGAAGAAYGYQTTFTYEERTYEGGQNAAIWGGAGLLAGFIINRVIFRQPRVARRFELSQSEEWLNSWNRVSDADYVIHESSPNGTLVLAPLAAITAIRHDLERLESDLARSYNSSTGVLSCRFFSKMTRLPAVCES